MSNNTNAGCAWPGCFCRSPGDESCQWLSNNTIPMQAAGAAAVPATPPDEWENAQRISDLPAVDEAIRNLLNDSTADNATCLVREVLRASPSPASTSAPAAWIPVEERMPEPGTDCIVWCREMVPGFGPYPKFDRWDEQREAPVSFSSATIPIGLGWDESDFEDVTHWMPRMPAPGEGAPDAANAGGAAPFAGEFLKFYPELAQLVNACKQEWQSEGSWSEWDQSVYQRFIALAPKAQASVQPCPCFDKDGARISPCFRATPTGAAPDHFADASKLIQADHLPDAGKMIPAADESTRAPDGWRCFHCDQVFTDADAAREHFGSSEIQQPACQIDIAEYRRMQEAHRRQCEEDTDWHRAFYKLGGEHTRAMQQWGDLEYARGLRDGVNLPADSPERASLASGERPSAPAPEGEKR